MLDEQSCLSLRPLTFTVYCSLRLRVLPPLIPLIRRTFFLPSLEHYPSPISSASHRVTSTPSSSLSFSYRPEHPHSSKPTHRNIHILPNLSTAAYIYLTMHSVFGFRNKNCYDDLLGHDIVTVTLSSNPIPPSVTRVLEFLSR